MPTESVLRPHRSRTRRPRPRRPRTRKVATGVASALALCLVVVGATIAVRQVRGDPPPHASGTHLGTHTKAGSVAYVDGNGVLEEDGTHTKLTVPAGYRIVDTTETPSGYAFDADSDMGGSGVFFEFRNGTVHRFPLADNDGRFVVSHDGKQMIVSGMNKSDRMYEAIWYSLPALTVVSTYQTDTHVAKLGMIPVAAAGDWTVIDMSAGHGAPGWATEFGAVGDQRATFDSAMPFDVATDGSVLRRIDALEPSNGTYKPKTCYDFVPYRPGGDMSDVSGHCGKPPPNGVDSGALSPDGTMAALALGAGSAAVLVNTADLHAGRWHPVVLPMRAQIEYWDSPTTVIVHGEHFYRCHTSGACDILPGDDDLTLVRVIP
jgi:hypothetical protein